MEGSSTPLTFVDPAILSAISTSEQQQRPSLGVASTEDIKSSDPNRHFPAVAAVSPDANSPFYASDTTGTTESRAATQHAGDFGLGAHSTSGFNSNSNSGFTGAHGNTGSNLNSTGASANANADELANKASNTASDLSNRAANTTNDLSNRAADTTSNLAQSASATASDAARSANNLASSANQAANNVAQTANATTNTLADKATNAKNSIVSSVEPTVQGLRSRANQLSAQASSATQQAAEHPAVQNAKQSAEKQVGQFREFLGNFPVVKDLEKRTGVDRVVLVAGGVFAYLLLVPLNLFGLALPVTQFLTFVPPTILALDLLERRNSSVHDEDTKAVLAYFVILGFIQFIESLAPGLLASWIPQYWTVKLIFLAYLIHPQTKGALKIHNNFLRNFASSSRRTTQTQTPPTTNPFTSSSVSSPTFQARGLAQDRVDDFNVPKVSARGEAFEVVSERH